MQFTKKLEKELLTVMEDYWSSYFSGDLETWASYLPDHYRNIGTTKEEIWSSKQDIVDYTQMVIDQMVGMADLRNKTTQMVPYDPYIMVHEFGDMYVNAEEGWVYYAPFRLSSLLEKTNDGWKILHQHGSFPDSKADAGEAFGFDQLKVENTRLRDAIQSRTLELERKNRELEIEASLERVRAVAMAMHRPKDILNICEVVFNELQALGFEALRNAIIHVFEKDQKHWIDFDYSNTSGGTMTHVPYTGNSLLEKFIGKIRKAKDSFFEMEISGPELQGWKDFRQATDMHDDPRLDQVEALYYYVYSVGEASIGISSYQSISPEQLGLLKRFRNVFDLAYGRYGDIRKAEAQARDAQIETALERVRAKSMAMHKSEDLADLSLELVKQVHNLGIDTWFCAFNINEGDEKGGLEWGSNGQGVFPKYRTPREGIFLEYYKAGQKGETLFIKEIGEDECPAHYEYLCTLPGVGDQLLKIKEAGISFPTSQIDHVAFFKYGYILFITFEPVPESHDIFKRFAKVFEQTYTRFLDLQKAEAQAREAQIEASLERVRAQTMAMHNSEDVGKCIVKMFDELTALGVDEGTRFGIGILNNDNDINQLWTASKDGKEIKMHIGNLDMTLHPLLKSARKAWKEQVPLHRYVLEGEDLLNYYQMLNKAPAYKFQTALEKLPEREFHYGFVFDHGFFYAFNPHEFQPDLIHIIQRFSSQFGQTYQRYLDLVKAEGQAREAQIEAALEKVRSSSLAVNKVNEFNQVVQLVFEKLGEFQIPVSSVTIATLREGSKDMVVFGCGEGESGLATLKFDLPYFSNAFIDDLLQVRTKSVEGYFSNVYSEKDKNNYYDHVFEHTELRNLPEDLKERVRKSKSYGLSTAYAKHSMIMVNDFHGNTLEEDQGEILIRFSNVFEQAYVRFLDLQKAEAQAREGQIEAALERVRSRTMGMQKSEELKEVIQVIFEQFVHLKILVQHTGFLIDYKNRDDMLIWLADENAVFPQISIPYFDSPHWNNFLEAKEKGQNLFSNYLNFEDKNAFYEELFTHIPDLTEETKEYYFQCPGLAISTVLMDNVGLYIENFEGKPYADEEHNILLRFGKVFQQTYTRFLDLQRAEAQAREAQIEAALERTRTQSMLMQHSDELNKVSNTFHEQLLLLELPTEFSYVWLPDEANQTHMFWATWSENHKGKTFSQSKSVTYPLDKSEPYTSACYKMWGSDQSVFVNRIAPEEVINFFSSWGELLSDAEHMKANLFPEGLYYAEAYMKYGCFGINIARSLSVEEQQVLLRFSIEFERAYTRFLDLKKAEAQAREGRIEAALEKVRSRTMAMQSSNELPEAANLLFLEVQALGIPTWSAGYNILSADNRTAECWMSSEGTIQPPFTLYFEKEKSFIEQYDFFRSEDNFLLQELSGKALEQHYDYMKSIPKIGHIIINLEHSGISLPTHQINHLCKFEQGYLLFITYEPVPEAHELFIRFTKVFEQTYTRFLDLQRAEAQAREAQIEVALERVRARTIAMHHSDELFDAAELLYREFFKLGVPPFSCGFVINEDDAAEWKVWMTDPTDNSFGEYWTVPVKGDPVLSSRYRSWKRKEKFHYAELEGATNVKHHKFIAKYAPFKKGMLKNLPHRLVLSSAHFSLGHLLLVSPDRLTEEIESLLCRFATVFEQTYTRFLDLQKTEAQARESQIELSLERIRSQAMAMQQSTDLLDIVVTMRREFVGLGHEAQYFWHMMWLPDTYEKAMTSGDGSRIGMVMELPRRIHGEIQKLSEWEKSDESTVVFTMDVEATLDYVHKMVNWGDFQQIDPNMPSEDDIRHIGGLTYIMSRTTHGEIGYSLPGVVENPPEEDIRILERFAAAFDLAHRRFLDLQQTEAQAREVEIELALEKVRSRTMAMQKADELHEVVTLVVEKLMDLGVILDANGVILCTYFKDSRDVLHWIASPDFSFSGSYLLPYFDHPIFSSSWESKLSGAEYFSKSFTVEEKNSFFEYAFEHSDYKHFPDEFKEWVFQNDKHSLSFAWSENSAILIPSHTGVLPSEDDVEILKRFANVFEQAYVRFMDLQVKEEQSEKLTQEKQRLEKTLQDLQATQNQLIHAEKMASLGELTAGIAHEIQNPLNFVNNFSEVSSELVQEAKEEIEKGELKEAAELLSDLTQNLEKITHHGGRASSIVKGMLDHSRSSSGEKELVDINALCDEYLRLAYHGMRAKDKSFNAKFESHFDENLPNVNIIPQDIGRVILNIINNAFQAISLGESGKRISESTNKQSSGLVTVSTSQINKHIQITIADNGPGIPDNVKDKIFQPFFTTKPTGQGTGLGLSLSYDIVKAHGGEIKVESEEGEGTEFIIHLPIV